MKMNISLVLITAILSVIIQTVTPMHIHKKRDLFITQGWGASGMPYSSAYLSEPPQPEALARLMGQMKRATPQYDEKQWPKKSVTPIEDNSIATTGGMTSLLMSNGWGPLGR